MEKKLVVLAKSSEPAPTDRPPARKGGGFLFVRRKKWCPVEAPSETGHQAPPETGLLSAVAGAASYLFP